MGKIKSADEPQRRLLKKQATRPQKSFEESSKRYSLTPSPTTGADERKPEKLRLDEPVFGQKNDILRNRTFSEGKSKFYCFAIFKVFVMLKISFIV